MMKVCTPEGTIKRVECLDEPIFNNTDPKEEDLDMKKTHLDS